MLTINNLPNSGSGCCRAISRSSLLIHSQEYLLRADAAHQLRARDASVNDCFRKLSQPGRMAEIGREAAMTARPSGTSAIPVCAPERGRSGVSDEGDIQCHRHEGHGRTAAWASSSMKAGYPSPIPSGTRGTAARQRERGCCQSNRNSSPIDAAVAGTREPHAMRFCHSASAAERRVL
jgi:hypothetical protein